MNKREKTKIKQSIAVMTGVIGGKIGDQNAKALIPYFLKMVLFGYFIGRGHSPQKAVKKSEPLYWELYGDLQNIGETNRDSL